MSWRDVELRPTDFVIVGLVAVAVGSDLRGNLRVVLRRWLWFTPFAALLLLSAVSVPDAGPVTVAALKVIEYLVLGIAATALLGSRRALHALMVSMVLCAALLGAVGAMEVMMQHRAGVRATSLIGTDPLGLLGAATFTGALAAPTVLGSRRILWLAYASGAACLVVSASISAVVGLALAGGYAAVRHLGPFARRRAVPVAAIAVLAVGLMGTLVATRWSDVRAATRQVTGSSAQPQPGGSFVQRMMFADFGTRIWLDNPVLGVGFQQSSHEGVWAQYFASVRADFPALPISYFPNFPGMSFGQPTSETDLSLHNIYSQLLAETGLVGLALFVMGVAGVARPAFRSPRGDEVATLGALLVLVVLGAFTRNGLYGGLPETALFVLALAIAARSGRQLTHDGLP